jgi:ech hydrogenase subunit A
VILCIACCICMPLISDGIVRPYIEGMWGQFYTVLSSDNLWIASICSIFVVCVLFGALGRPSKKKKVGIYLSGVSADNEARVFRNSMSGTSMATSRNWYMESFFGEAVLNSPGTIICSAIIIIAFGIALLMYFAGISIPGLV